MMIISFILAVKAQSSDSVSTFYFRTGEMPGGCPYVPTFNDGNRYGPCNGGVHYGPQSKYWAAIAGGGSRCGQSITMTYQGRSINLVVMDECPGCHGDNHVDMSLDALIELTGSVEAACAIHRMPARVSWGFGGGQPAPQPAPQPAAQQIVAQPAPQPAAQQNVAQPPPQPAAQQNVAQPPPQPAAQHFVAPAAPQPATQSAQKSIVQPEVETIANVAVQPPAGQSVPANVQNSAQQSELPSVSESSDNLIELSSQLSEPTQSVTTENTAPDAQALFVGSNYAALFGSNFNPRRSSALTDCSISYSLLLILILFQ